MVSHGLRRLTNAYYNSLECVCSRKQYLQFPLAIRSDLVGIRTEAQHCVPLRMNPNFSDAAFHIRLIPDVLSISAADVNSF